MNTQVLTFPGVLLGRFLNLTFQKVTAFIFDGLNIILMEYGVNQTK